MLRYVLALLRSCIYLYLLALTGKMLLWKWKLFVMKWIQALGWVWLEVCVSYVSHFLIDLCHHLVCLHTVYVWLIKCCHLLDMSWNKANALHYYVNSFNFYSWKWKFKYCEYIHPAIWYYGQPKFLQKHLAQMIQMAVCKIFLILNHFLT